MYNPTNVADSVGEWVEILNYGCNDIDLSGWTIEDTAGASNPDPLEVLCGGGGSKSKDGDDSMVLKSGEYALILDQDSVVLLEEMGNIPSGTKIFQTDDMAIGQGLNNNDGDTITLKDSGGNIIQELDYSGSACGNAANGDNFSIERTNPLGAVECGNFISDEIETFGFESGGTPGFQNNIWSGTVTEFGKDCVCS